MITKKESNDKFRRNHLAKLRARDRWRNMSPERKVQKLASTHRRRAANREAYLAYSHSYYLKNKEHILQMQKDRRVSLGLVLNQRQRWYSIKHKHGITEAQFNAMLEAQGGKCALCPTEHGTTGKGGKLHIDHDHQTGKVRGLLCMFCNHAIERLDNHDGWADRAQSYLRRPR